MREKHAKPDHSDINKARQSQEEGIRCPECGCQHLYVLYTRRTFGGIMRARECRNCGRRTRTFEKSGQEMSENPPHH